MAVTFVGNVAFEQSAPEQYGLHSSGLDSLAVQFRGSVSNLSGFMATRSRWQASTLDSNFFLDSWESDGDRVFPTVTCHYIGCRGGAPPPPLEDVDEPIQQANYTAFAGSPSISITYVSPVTQKRSITRTRPSGSIGAVHPANARIIWFVAVGIVLPSDYSALAYFAQRLSRTQSSRELVPNQYYETIETKSHLLFSLGT